MNAFIMSAWKGLTYDEEGFSTKKTAYVVSVIVVSYIVMVFPPTWEILTLYILQCTSPGTIREFIAMKAGKTKLKEESADD